MRKANIAMQRVVFFSRGAAVLLLIGLGLLVQHIRARQRLDVTSASTLDSVWPEEPTPREPA